MSALIGTKEAARVTGMSARTIQRLASERKIPSAWIAGAWRFRPEELVAWIEGEFDRQAPRAKKPRAQKPAPPREGGIAPFDW